jgi:hypothetical protein
MRLATYYIHKEPLEIFLADLRLFSTGMSRIHQESRNGKHTALQPC